MVRPNIRRDGTPSHSHDRLRPDSQLRGTPDKGSALARVRDACAGLGLPIIDTPRGFLTRCPVHEGPESDPSLNVDQGEKCAVLKCRSADCGDDAIAQALGLTRPQLFDDYGSGTTARPRREEGGPPPLAGQKKPGVGFADVQAVLAWCEQKNAGSSASAFVYEDCIRRPQLLVVRLDFADGRKKQFRELHCKAGRWHFGADDAHLLYRMPELLEADYGTQVLVVEGERKVELLRRLGFVATCSPNGAKNAGKVNWSALAGRDVVVLPDNDQAGTDYAVAVAKHATDVGAVSVRVLKLPDLEAGEDVIDWHRRIDEDDMAQVMLKTLLQATKPKPLSAVDAVWRPTPPDFLERTPAPRRWLLQHPNGDGLLPLGRVGLLASMGGVGKSQVVLQLAVSIATGRDWLGHFKIGDEARGRVLLGMAEEDDEELQRRLYQIAKALDLSLEERRAVVERVQLLPLAGHPVALLKNDAEGNAAETVELQRLRALLDRDAGHDGWSLVVLDPLSRWAGLETDANNTAATRVMQAVESLTKSPGNPTCLVPAHSSKKANEEGSVNVRGASGLQDAARWVATMSHALDGRAKFVQTKSNYSKPMPEPLILQRDDNGVLRAMSETEKQLVESIKAEAHRMDVESAAKKVLQVVTKAEQAGEPFTNKKKLAAALGRRKEVALEAIDLAIERRWIRKDDEADAYVVADDDQAEQAGT